MGELKKEDLPSDNDTTTSSTLSELLHIYMIFNATTALTGITDLAKVKGILKNIVDWKSLGLELGLLYPSLKKIETDQRGLVEQCKTEMLAAWLQRHDHASQPSWSVLRTALEQIGEKELADSISTKYQ